ncbi:MAG: GNAT family N-acetyltransferase [Candidatus Binatia bacterium]
MTGRKESKCPKHTTAPGVPGRQDRRKGCGIHVPAQRGHGIARALLEQFGASAEDLGITAVFTLARNEGEDIAEFFRHLGFVQGKMLHFQKEITS